MLKDFVVYPVYLPPVLVHTGLFSLLITPFLPPLHPSSSPFSSTSSALSSIFTRPYILPPLPCTLYPPRLAALLSPLPFTSLGAPSTAMFSRPLWFKRSFWATSGMNWERIEYWYNKGRRIDICSVKSSIEIPMNPRPQAPFDPEIFGYNQVL